MKIQLSNLSLSFENDYATLCQIRDSLDVRAKEMLNAVQLEENEIQLVRQGKKINAVKALRERMSREGRECGLKFCKDVIWAYADESQRKMDILHAKRTVYRDIKDLMDAAWQSFSQSHPDV